MTALLLLYYQCLPRGAGSRRSEVWADELNVTRVLFHSSLGQNFDFSAHSVFSVLLVSEPQTGGCVSSPTMLRAACLCHPRSHRQSNSGVIYSVRRLSAP